MESLISPTMAWHAMKILRTTTKYLKTIQTPVMVADQPLFSLAKKSNENSLKHNLVKNLSWSYLGQCIQKQEASRPL